MRRIAVIAIALLAGCPDEERTAALEKQVKELDDKLAATRKELDDAVDDMEQRRDANAELVKKLDEVTAKLAKLESGGSRFGTAPPRPRRPEPDRSKTYSMPVEGFPSLGPADAKVTIVKAYDYACPFCEKSRQTMKDLVAKYRGDVRVVWKPLVVHPNNAMAGALAVCAADKQGKFAQMDAMIWDKGFNNNRALDASDVTTPNGREKCWDTADGCALVVGYARDLQLNVSRFKRDMKDCQAVVAASQRDFQSLVVGATPSFFVNGRFISGAVPIDQFVPVVDEELEKAKARIASGTPARRYYDEWVVGKGLRTVDPVVPDPLGP